MQIILRCVLDTEEDVLRDISISDSQTLEQLHDAIIESFELNPGEMAAFYKTNDDWDQGEEFFKILDFLCHRSRFKTGYNR